MNKSATKIVTFICSLAMCIVVTPVDAGAYSFQQCSRQLRDYQNYTINRIPSQDDVNAWRKWCNPNPDIGNQVIEDILEEYGFVEDWWDEGYGYNDRCNITLPFSKTMNAHLQIEHAKGANYNLKGIGDRAGEAIDETYGGKCEIDYYGYAMWTPFGYHISYFMPFFYEIEDVASRSTTVIHEARHAQGHAHTFPFCPNKASCDWSWDSWGANTQEVMWSYHVIDNNALLTDPGGCGALYDDLRDDAQYNVDARFVMSPDMVLDDVTCVPWDLEDPEVVYYEYAEWLSLPTINIPQWLP